MENRKNQIKSPREKTGQEKDNNHERQDDQSPREGEVKNYRYPLEDEADMDVESEERTNNHFGGNPSV